LAFFILSGTRIKEKQKVPPYSVCLSFDESSLFGVSSFHFFCVSSWLLSATDDNPPVFFNSPITPHYHGLLLFLLYPAPSRLTVCVYSVSSFRRGITFHLKAYKKTLLPPKLIKRRRRTGTILKPYNIFSSIVSCCSK
jgi:hypothetical protein